MWWLPIQGKQADDNIADRNTNANADKTERLDTYNLRQLCYDKTAGVGGWMHHLFVYLLEL